MGYIEEHRAGVIGTVIFHTLIILILFLTGFYTPLPLPGEEGVVVDFGTDNNGLGMEEPAPASVQTEETQAEPEPEPVSKPVPQVVNPPKPSEEEIMTQDMEKTAALEAAKKKKQEDKKRQQELDQQKAKEHQAELERIKKEKEEKRKEEAERKKKEAEQKKINEINNRAKNVFGASGQGTEGSKSTSQGVTYTGGNQGSPQGSPNAGNYGPGGGSGNGVSFSLGGRSALALPKPYYPGNEEGTVVVQVTVDKYGKVTKAEAGVKGSTTLIPELLAAAQKAALQAKFNVDQNAPAFQQGTITYRFVLD